MNKIVNFYFDTSKKPDLLIFWTAILLGLFGLIMVFSSSAVFSDLKYQDQYYLLRKQAYFFFIGISLMSLLAFLKETTIKKLIYPLLLLSFIALVLILVPQIGVRINAARRWIHFGFIGLQPGEFAKVGLVLYIAVFLAKRAERIRELIHGVVPVVSVVLIFSLLLVLEPDFGSAVLIGTILVLMLFVAGLRPAHLFLFFLLTAPTIYFLVMNVDYRRKRLLTFLNPWADPYDSGFQMIQSFLAFHSGGLFGVGFGDSKQKLLYLPEAHTDFIFSVIGEEFGFIGSLVLVGVFLFFILRSAFSIARIGDPFKRYAGFGLITLISLQTVFNMGVVLGILPTKGLALPFLSYGGSSLVCTYISVGLLLNFSARSNERGSHT